MHGHTALYPIYYIGFLVNLYRNTANSQSKTIRYPCFLFIFYHLNFARFFGGFLIVLLSDQGNFLYLMINLGAYSLLVQLAKNNENKKISS